MGVYAPVAREPTRFRSKYVASLIGALRHQGSPGGRVRSAPLRPPRVGPDGKADGRPCSSRTSDVGGKPGRSEKSRPASGARGLARGYPPAFAPLTSETPTDSAHPPAAPRLGVDREEARPRRMREPGTGWPRLVAEGALRPAASRAILHDAADPPSRGELRATRARIGARRTPLGHRATGPSRGTTPCGAGIAEVSAARADRNRRRVAGDSTVARRGTSDAGPPHRAFPGRPPSLPPG